MRIQWYGDRLEHKQDRKSSIAQNKERLSNEKPHTQQQVHISQSEWVIHIRTLIFYF